VFSWTQADEHPDFLLHELAKKTGLPRSSIAPWILGYIEGLTGVGRKAIASLVLGICGLFAWLLPIAGFPVTIVGGILGLQRLKSLSRRKAIAGVVLCAIGLMLTIINTTIDTNDPGRGNVSRTTVPRAGRVRPSLAPAPFERLDAIRLAEMYKDRIVKQHYVGGLYVEATVLDHIYDSAKRVRKVRVKLQWEGALTSVTAIIDEEAEAKSYEARGWLDVGERSWKWEEQYANQALKEWNVLRGVGKHAADWLQQQSSSSGYGFRFNNKCDHPVRLAIRYHDMNKVWRTEGWWTFKPGESGVLIIGGKTLKTNTTVWYFFAETTDDEGLVWRGNHTFNLNGRSLQMDKMEDTDGESNWSISCD
jgi:uncharacterized membrane protein